MLAINYRPRTRMRIEWSIPLAMLSVFLPWVAVVLFTAGAWATLNFLAYAMMVSAVGYLLVNLALPADARAEAFMLAPAAGILAISALTAFWVRLGLPLIWVSALWLGLAAGGVVCAWKDRALWVRGTVTYGGALVLLSVLICGLYFLPGARNDAVLRRDGSFNWIFVDTQFNHAISSAIKNSGSPPKEPGTATAELLYHFGGFAPAAAISRFDGLDLADAYARVTRGASFWALVLSCFGLGSLLSLKANGGKFGGIMSVAGLFFYGSLLALFLEDRDGAIVTPAILFRIPHVEIAKAGTAAGSLMMGHSVLHGLVAITAIMGLCLVQAERKAVPTWRGIILVALPALAVSVQSVGALYCFGVVGILLFWGRLGTVRSWLSIMLMSCLFLGAWKIMGYGHAPEALGTTFKMDLNWDWHWWFLVFWLTVGLGFRILALRWISQPLRDPFSALVLASVVGLLLFFLLVQFGRGQQDYGRVFLQHMFGIFAFSRLTSTFWRGAERAQWAAEWLKVAKWGMVVLLACALLLRIVIYAIHSPSYVASRRHWAECFLLTIFLTGTSALMKRSGRFLEIGSAILMGVLLFGFLAWIPTWVNLGLGRAKLDVTLMPGEVQGLKRLGALAAPGELFATNKHEVDSLLTDRALSYGYSALSEHPVLLEGYLYHTQTELPAFKKLLSDNDQIFTTTNPETLREIASAWHVRWLVARPSTDLALPRPLPAWLVEQQNCGDLKIYRID